MGDFRAAIAFDPAPTASVPGQLDSVYFLLFPSWETELRGNRWHFAVRWATRKPVVLVVPSLVAGSAISEPEARISNCRILRIQADGDPRDMVHTAQVQVGQILDDLTTHRHERPLLWCYNPHLVGPLARIPAVARLYHATEAYFDMPDIWPVLLRRLEAAVTISDLTVAVSDGVASSIRSRIGHANVVTVANGCDFKQYSAGTPDLELQSNGRSYNRIAVYAGNINARIDFGLLQQLVLAHPDVLFAFYGPRGTLTEPDGRAWQQLVGANNVFVPGVVDPDRLPDIYAAADVGIIPYRQDAYLVENGLPLKALEMCATGLPVVSTLMKPLAGLAAGLVVTTSASQFLEAFSKTSRTSVSASDAAELIAVSAANDYDRKFEEVIGALTPHLTESECTTRVDLLTDSFRSDWTASEVRFSRWLTLSLPARSLIFLYSLVPTPLRRRLRSMRIRLAVKQRFGL